MPHQLLATPPVIPDAWDQPSSYLKGIWAPARTDATAGFPLRQPGLQYQEGPAGGVGFPPGLDPPFLNCRLLRGKGNSVVLFAVFSFCSPGRAKYPCGLTTNPPLRPDDPSSDIRAIFPVPTILETLILQTGGFSWARGGNGHGTKSPLSSRAQAMSSSGLSGLRYLGCISTHDPQARTSRGIMVTEGC